MRRYLFLAMVLLASTVTLAQTWPITYNNVANPDLLRRLLQSRFDEVDDDLDEIKEVGTGKIFYVDSAVGSDTYDGTKPAWATATLDAAIALCENDRGDIIYVMQGHSETMGAAADEVDVDISGVTIIGLGDIDVAPLFDYTGDVTGAFAIGADDVKLINLRFHANVPDVNEAIEIESGSTGVSIINCIFDAEAEGTDEFLECIDSVGGTADKLIVVGCQFRMGAGACNAAINTKDADYMYVARNIVHGDYAVACIKNNTTASNHIVIADNILFNGTIGGNAGLNTEPCIELLATTTGVIENNRCYTNVATPELSIVAADCFLANNRYSETEADGGGQIIGTRAGERYVSIKTGGDVDGGDDLFDVDGGPIIIEHFVGLVTTNIQNQACTLEIVLDADTGYTDHDFTTAVDLDNDAAGTRIVFSTANEAVLTELAGADGGAGPSTANWFCGEGMIESFASASNSGAITWYMVWTPLIDGVTVTPQ